jgi:hypothetical protein
LGFSGRFFLGKRIEIISRYKSVVSGWRWTTQSFLRESGSSFEVFGGWEFFLAYFLGLGLKNLFLGWWNHMFAEIWHKICVHEGSSKKFWTLPPYRGYHGISPVKADITINVGGCPMYFGDSWCIQNPNWDDQNSWARLWLYNGYNIPIIHGYFMIIIMGNYGYNHGYTDLPYWILI